jgi:hypothetical protein
MIFLGQIDQNDISGYYPEILAKFNRPIVYFNNLKSFAGPLFVPRKPPQLQD